MTAKFNRSEFIATFKAEVDEHIGKLSKGLVKLEKNPNDEDIVKELFRIAHTLKGVARMMGFFEIQEIAHRMEDIFGAVTDKKIKFNPSAADKLFSALDAVKSILNSIIKDAKIEIDVASVCSSLELYLSKDPETPQAVSPEESKPRKKDRLIRKDAQLKEPLSEESLPDAEIKKEEISPADKASPDTVYSVKDDYSQVSGQIEEYVRVPLSRINKLLNLLGEMVINKIKTSQKIITLKKITKLTKDSQKRLANFFEEFKNDEYFRRGEKYGQALESLHQSNVDAEKIREEMLAIFENISNEALHMDPVIDELQQRMKEMRMLPCSSVFDEFPRLVRDIAYEQAKKVNFIIDGEDTELDKKVLEGIKSPLVHILRNCVDHGIETLELRRSLGKKEEGEIRLSASQEGGQVIIRIYDDGKGLDMEKIKQVALKKNLCSNTELSSMNEEQIYGFIFRSGFSTSPIITDISGRGIGLDVVKSQIDQLKGKVHVESEKGKGTLITLELPLTIAIIDVLLVKVFGQTFAFPVLSIEESLEVERSSISTIENKMAVQIRGHAVALAKLSDVLGLSSAVDEDAKEKKDEKFPVVVATSLEKRVGFIVDDIIGEQEVFIKSLGAHLGKVKNISGATILGTGDVIVILDIADLIASSRLTHPALSPARLATKEEKSRKKILVVEDSLTTRELERNMLQSHGYSVDVAIDGLEGLDKLAQSKYDLIVCDVQMPRMDGFQFCGALRKNEQYKEIPLIFVTALAKEEDKRRGIDVGAQAYIVKTAFDQANLLDAIERLIG
ncbi:MAG: hypothetical protein COV72_03555 [Candidatus Omnitrophica bacterium CG11_big_fil_rev_8_21_14_0_20_42_13]|uniref:histidine kinase n=1 Tax=Candidatus Ghiorseimicrobium undicola TaxID=1974746 RepID=A0A2H0LY72_9BACT|nr:MAG: hypothetical protein COV72_03555 [Candidatus Omnitrophica bacterium CG11_big_fil_rev_8_21_14_0_20_42_13]